MKENSKQTNITNKTKNETKYCKLNVPGSIQIGKYTYTFKEQLKSDENKFSYRCKKFICRIPITIDRLNLNKITNPNNKEEIKYIIKKNHKCDKKDEVKIENPEKCSSEEDLINKAIDIIKLNPLEALTYQKAKLESEKIFLNDEKIKRLMYQIRNDLYIKDEEILKYINHITITFDSKVTNAKNIPFVPVYNKFINTSKGNRQESFIIVTSYFNLNFFSKASHIFFDATFKVAPKNFYQILNILVLEEESNLVFPAAHVIMTNKSYDSYKKVFKEIKYLLDQYNIKYDLKNTIINCDFEKSLINTIREEFRGVKIYGCYFHYVKALWRKARNISLTKKNLLENIVFCIKIYPFILKDKKDFYINEVYDFAKSIDKSYNSFIKYFKKNWENSKFLEFDILGNGDIYNRTNNMIESFHHKLNNVIEYKHPRISILLDKLKDFSIHYYHKYVSKFFNESNDNIHPSNIFNDIYNFMEKFLQKYNFNINIKLLLQDEGDTKNDLVVLSKNIINLFYNVKECKKDEPNNIVNNENNNSDTIDNFDDLSENWWNISKDDKALNEKSSFNEDENFTSFNIDYEPFPKKRKYNDVDGNIIKSLYEINQINNFLNSKKN